MLPKDKLLVCYIGHFVPCPPNMCINTSHVLVQQLTINARPILPNESLFILYNVFQIYWLQMTMTGEEGASIY